MGFLLQIVVVTYLYWTFRLVLRLSNVKVVVTLRFASHRLLNAMYWTAHMLRLPNMNVMVALCFALLLRALY